MGVNTRNMYSCLQKYNKLNKSHLVGQLLNLQQKGLYIIYYETCTYMLLFITVLHYNILHSFYTKQSRSHCVYSRWSVHVVPNHCGLNEPNVSRTTGCVPLPASVSPSGRRRERLDLLTALSGQLLSYRHSMLCALQAVALNSIQIHSRLQP